MKRLIITATAFTGEVHAKYGPDNRFQSIDFSACTISDAWLQALKENLPVLLYAELPQEWAAKKIQVIMEGYKVDFDRDFWLVYGKPVHHGRCLKLWDKFSDATQFAAAAGVRPYLAHLEKNSWKGKADPLTYLRNEYWKTDWTKVR